MDNSLIILHVILCFTLLPFLLRNWGRIFKVAAIFFSLCATPLALVFGPVSFLIGILPIWLFHKLFGMPLD